MRILVTGATGLIGKALIRRLFESSISEVNVLSRNPDTAVEKIGLPVNSYYWNPAKDEVDSEAFKDIDVVIHLAGEGIANSRWSESQKKKILDSRVKTTELLISEINKSSSGLKKFISASAIGIYGDRGDEVLVEESKLGDGFLADVCKAWEESLVSNLPENTQCHFLRTGIVLSSEGGALEKMLPPFTFGVGGRLGSGAQYMSWIHIDDLVSQYMFLIDSKTTETVFNAVSPEPVSNAEFTKVLAKTLKRPAIFPVPKFVLKSILGEMSDLLLQSQKVEPKAFLSQDFEFKFPVLEMALDDILQYQKKGEHLFSTYQLIDRPVEEVFDFFKDEKNLERITPEFLNFRIKGMSTENIQKDTIIKYRLSLRGLPIEWHSLIKEFEPNKKFIDFQLKGPYKKWEHTHRFIPLGEKTLITDHVVYKLPMGTLGNVFAGSFVKKDVNSIFEYRQRSILEILK